MVKTFCTSLYSVEAFFMADEFSSQQVSSDVPCGRRISLEPFISVFMFIIHFMFICMLFVFHFRLFFGAPRDSLGSAKRASV